VDESQTYSLYLPSNYDAEARWPLLLVFDPRGRSVEAAGLFTAAAEEYGWIILSSNDTRSDSGMEPNQRAINALWSEIQSRYSVERRRIYAAGFSGTVVPAMLLSKATGGIAGVIGVGGRFFPEVLDGHDGAVFGAVGDTDFNYLEVRKIHRYLTDRGTPNRLVVFEGSHGWMPEEVAYDSIGWLEVQAMRTGARARNEETISEFYAKDVAAAERLMADEHLLQAKRKYDAIASDYEGLLDVGVAVAKAAELANRAEVRRARKTEKRLDAREERYAQEMQEVLDGFVVSDPAVPPDRLASQLQIDDLKRTAAEGGDEALMAQRMLNTVFVATSFYLTRDLLARDMPDHAASVLGVACLIRDDNPVVWYNRGCALARTGRRSSALDALEKAVELGFNDADLMRNDSDLESVRDDKRFVAIIERLGGF
jgi:predicted esterase